MKKLAQARNSEKGAILAMSALVLVILLLATGMAVDLGMAYGTSSRLSKAVDAAALAGARVSGMSNAEIEQLIQQVAAANLGGSNSISNAASFDVTIDNGAGQDTRRVNVVGTTDSPTFFARVVGKNEIGVASGAEATRFPIDMSLVLDVSYSLAMSGSFDDMQQASSNFLTYFDDNIDQIGLVSYTTWAEHLMQPQTNFISNGTAIINGLTPQSDTNIDEGLHYGLLQLDNADLRETSTKVIVLFTDGRPTAFTSNFWVDGSTDTCQLTEQEEYDAANPDIPGGGACAGCSIDSDADGKPDCYYGHASAYGAGNWFRGTFQHVDGKKVLGWNADGSINLTYNQSSQSGQAAYPIRLPDGSPTNGNFLRTLAMAEAEEWADEIREKGYFIYTIALGNPNGPSYLQPDLDFLRRVANDRGISSWTQPKGELLYAPTAADLESTFAKLAEKLLLRLTN